MLACGRLVGRGAWLGVLVVGDWGGFLATPSEPVVGPPGGDGVWVPSAVGWPASQAVVLAPRANCLAAVARRQPREPCPGKSYGTGIASGAN